MAGTQIPIYRIRIPQKVINDTRAFMIKKGNEGYEGLVFWIGYQVEPGCAVVSRAYIPPEQIARRTRFGVSVTLPPEGHTKLIKSIKTNEIILVKLHSHPKEAYLSDVDKENHVFRFEGALQIIVPDFAYKPFGDLTHCAVFRYEKGKWRPFSTSMIRQTFSVEPKLNDDSPKGGGPLWISTNPGFFTK